MQSTNSEYGSPHVTSLLSLSLLFHLSMSGLFFITSCCFTAQTINQPKPVQQAKIGDSVTIQCYVLKNDFNLIVWYKQLLGKKPQPIAMSYYRNNVHFLKGFDDGRLGVTMGNGTYHLNIFRMTQEDVASYYCGVIKLTALYFSSGTFLMITSKYSVVLLQKPVHLSDNITLQCTIRFMDDCAKPNVYWLKQSSGESRARIIDGNKDAHFIMAATQTCVYNFTMRILTLSDTGTYYCAMDVDGEIIIGHGTKLTIADTGNLFEVLSLYSDFYTVYSSFFSLCH
uniref:Ig-like domain-containing protein n=1 Tax=Sinocyclocheilus rhinocerous TaxID=307959 RepID=A0A673HLF8_9TELE